MEPSPGGRAGLSVAGQPQAEKHPKESRPRVLSVLSGLAVRTASGAGAPRTRGAGGEERGAAWVAGARLLTCPPDEETAEAAGRKEKQSRPLVEEAGNWRFPIAQTRGSGTFQVWK